MPTDSIKKKTYASTLESMLRHRTKINLKGSFDYESFLRDLHPATIQSPGFPITAEPYAEYAETLYNESINPRFSDELNAAEEKAAVSGKFDPAQLIAKSIPINDRRILLSYLAPN